MNDPVWSDCNIGRKWRVGQKKLLPNNNCYGYFGRVSLYQPNKNILGGADSKIELLAKLTNLETKQNLYVEVKFDQFAILNFDVSEF